MTTARSAADYRAALRARLRKEVDELLEATPENLPDEVADILEAGVALMVLQKRLGHSSVAITGDIYSHVSHRVDLAAADQVCRSGG